MPAAPANDTALPSAPLHTAGCVQVVELERWFVGSVPPSPKPRRGDTPDADTAARGPVRVWGYRQPGNRLWRSSSIGRALQPGCLVTRYGTHIVLRGPLDAFATAAAGMPHRVVQLFTNGFPSSWRDAFRSMSAAQQPLLPPQRQLVPPLKTRAAAQSSKTQPEPMQPTPPPRKKQRSSSRLTQSSSQVEHPAEPSHERVSVPSSPACKRPARSNSNLRPATVTVSPERTIRSQRKRPRAVNNAMAPVVVHSKNQLGNANNNMAKKHCVKPRKRRRKQVDFAPHPTTFSNAQNDEIPSHHPNAEASPLQGSRKSTGSDLRAHNDDQGNQEQSALPAPVSVEGNAAEADFPGTPMSQRWSSEQLAAYEEQRRSIPADAPDYWMKVSEGVTGKSAAECSALWDSQWASPVVQGQISFAKKLPMASTPELLSQVVTARPAAKKTLRYKSNLRKVVSAINRDANDDIFEPDLGGADDGLQLDGLPTLPIVCDLRRGTPDTGAKMRRAEAERRGAVQTPEILARGRSFGLAEADQYLAVFHRRRARQTAKLNASAATQSGKVPQTRPPNEIQASSTVPSNLLVNDIYGREGEAEAEGGHISDSENSDHFEYLF